MYESLKELLAGIREDNSTHGELIEKLQDVVLEVTVYRHGEDFAVKLALFLSLVGDLVEEGRITGQDVCRLADDLVESRSTRAEEHTNRVAASLRRLVPC